MVNVLVWAAGRGPGLETSSWSSSEPCRMLRLEEADDETTRGYINEIGMLEKLQGEDRIVRLFDHETVEEDNVLYVIMEKGDTDLASLLKKYVNKEVNILLLRSELNL